MIAVLLAAPLVILSVFGSLAIYNADCAKWIKVIGITWIWLVIYSHYFSPQ